MYHVEASVGPVHILRPPCGSNLFSELEEFVRAEGINLGRLSGVGAVSSATLRYYNQPKKTWIDQELDRRLEVAGMWGNVSLMSGEPIVHLHCVLADEKGNCYGGHLGHDTVVFNLEIILVTFSGPSVMRKMDEETGLTIWQ